MLAVAQRIVLIASLWSAAGICLTPSALADSNQILLERQSGIVDYLQPGEKPVPVEGRLAVHSEDYAITGMRSIAALALPDSSLVSIGSSSKVRVGSFSGKDGVSSMTVAIVGGALHFFDRRAPG